MITYTTEFYDMFLQYYENSLKQTKNKKKENKTKQKKLDKILLTIKIEKII